MDGTIVGYTYTPGMRCQESKETDSRKKATDYRIPIEGL